MTYPLIGNYGMVDDDYERDTPTLGALIVRDFGSRKVLITDISTNLEKGLFAENHRLQPCRYCNLL